MNRAILLCLALPSILVACGGPFGKWELRKNTYGEIESGTSRSNVEIVTKDGVQYQIEHSGAHPALSWAVGPNRLAAIANNVADSASYNTINMLEGNRYIFLKECRGISKVGDEKYGSLQELQVTFRVLEYADKETMYIFRDVDMSGSKFKTFIVVASWQKTTGNYNHWIEQRTNEISEIKYCRD